MGIYSLPDKLAAATEAALSVLNSPRTLPFVDAEVDAAKQSVMLKRNKSSKVCERILEEMPCPAKNVIDTEIRDRESVDVMTAADLQRAWEALTSLSDPFIVLGTSGSTGVASALPFGEIVSDRVRRPSTPMSSTSTISLQMVD